jgi:hypothetical protein
VLAGYEPHGNNLEDHLASVDDQKHHINKLTVLTGDKRNLVVHRQAQAVEHDDDEDKVVEVWVDDDKLDDAAAERIGDGQATQGYCGVVASLLLLLGHRIVDSRLGREGVADRLHRLAAELAQREAGDLNSLVFHIF